MIEELSRGCVCRRRLENRQEENHDCLFNSFYAVWIVYFFQPQNLFELLKNIMANFL